MHASKDGRCRVKRQVWVKSQSRQTASAVPLGFTTSAQEGETSVLLLSSSCGSGCGPPLTVFLRKVWNAQLDVLLLPGRSLRCLVNILFSFTVMRSKFDPEPAVTISRKIILFLFLKMSSPQFLLKKAT